MAGGAPEGVKARPLEKVMRLESPSVRVVPEEAHTSKTGTARSTKCTPEMVVAASDTNKSVREVEVVTASEGGKGAPEPTIVGISSGKLSEGPS